MTNKSYLNKVRRLFGNEIPDFMKKAVSEIKYQQRVASLKRKGAIPLSEIREDFEKLSWDIYRRTKEPNSGSIWVKETIKNAVGENEDWLVVYTDDQDKIIRKVKASKKIAIKNLQKVFDTMNNSIDLDNCGELGDIPFGDHKWTKQDIRGWLDGAGYKYSENDVNELWNMLVELYEPDMISGLERFGSIKKTSSKTSHSPGTIVQIDVPHGNLYEKYNGKIGEVVAAVPDRSKVSFKDLPSTWFEDAVIRPVSLCSICNAKMSLQMLKKLGTIRCKCGASYSKKQLEKIATENRINKVASEKTASIKKAKIVEKGNEFCVIAESGRSMGCYPSRKKAEERLQQVEMFKHMKGKKAQEEELEPLGDVWKLEDASILLSDLCEKAIEGNEDLQKFLVDLWDGESWERIKGKLETEGSVWYVWWMDGVHKFMEMLKSGNEKISKKAQNVIFWFDSPSALKALKHLTGPPTSPAKEPSKGEPEDLEEVELEPEGEEVEKEASKKSYTIESETCPKCGSEMTMGASHIAEGELQWECHKCGYIEQTKRASIKKEADSMEALRGAGQGSGSDRLEPMSWNVQESKTPKIFEKPEEQEEEIETEDVGEIHVVVNPDTKEVNVSFEDEEGEKIEEKPEGVEGPKGAEAPTTKKPEEEPETEEITEEEEEKSEPATPVIF